MEQIKLFSGGSKEKLEEEVNTFLRDKKVVDIQYQFQSVISRYDKHGFPGKIETINRIMVVYEDKVRGK